MRYTPNRDKYGPEWIGVDLDGTLAHYEGFKGPDQIGRPIPRMLSRVKLWLAEGRDVRIFTARVWGLGYRSEADRALRAIEEWCAKHIGAILPVTCEKNYSMVELWDDRAVQVESNTGRRIDGKEPPEQAQIYKPVRDWSHLL